MDWFKSGLAEAQKRAQEAGEQAQKLAQQVFCFALQQAAHTLTLTHTHTQTHQNRVVRSC